MCLVACVITPTFYEKANINSIQPAVTPHTYTCLLSNHEDLSVHRELMYDRLLLLGDETRYAARIFTTRLCTGCTITS